MYTKSPFDGKPSTRKSVRYYAPDGSGRAFQPSLYTHMFVEDLHLAIMPIGGRSENADFAVKLESESKEAEMLVSRALPSHFGREFDLTRAVCHFMDEAVNIIAYYGKAYYEIVYYYGDSSREKIEGFELENIMNRSVISPFGFPMQILPGRVVDERTGIARPIILLPKKEMMILSFPRQLGGPSGYRRLLSQLQWLSGSVVPDFAREDMARQKQTKGYDFSVYKRNQSAFLAGITKHLGWTARQLFNEESLEFYQIYRILKFEKSRAILREYVLNQLNRSLHLIGRRIGFKDRIRLEGIPRSEDYDEYMEQLLAGELSFHDAIKIMRR